MTTLKYSLKTQTWYCKIDKYVRFTVPVALHKNRPNLYYLYRAEEDALHYRSSSQLKACNDWRFAIPLTISKALNYKADTLVSIHFESDNEFIIRKESFIDE